MQKSRLAPLKKIVKKLLVSNSITARLLKRKYERHLSHILIDHRIDCVVHPTADPEVFAIRKENKVMVLNLATDATNGGTIAKFFDVFFYATKSDEVNGFQLVDYSKPKLFTLSDGLQFEFYSFPEEPSSIADYTRWYTPKPGDLVYDLGSNCGISVYHFSKMVGPTGRVICFEPDPVNLGFLRRNIARHGLDNLTIVEAAIGAADGTAQFSSEGSVASAIVTMLPREPVGNVITVPVMSLESAFRKYGVPNFCKIDIEAAEVEALDAAAALLRTVKTNFAVDTSHWLNGDFTCKPVEEAFRRGGHESETITNIFQTTYARPPAA